MLQEIRRQFKISILVLIIFTIITGVLYPFLTTLVGKIFFSYQTQGSLIKQNGTVIGSELIGQYFDSPIYFWSRPSATPDFPYNGNNSEASNLGPSNPLLLKTITDRVKILQKTNGTQLIPIDLVTASGSGLDPDISPAAAFYQIPRVAKARKLSENTVRKIVEAHIQGRQFGVLGEPRVNVLKLNLALDSFTTNEKNSKTKPNKKKK